MKRIALVTAIGLVGSVAAVSLNSAQADADFQGKIELRGKDSIPWWPPQPTAPAQAPNVVLIMLDDVGFGASSTFGGPVPTPTFDKLASRGLKYTQFHTTALCSPTRAALITGRNHHSVHTGCITELATGFPGYDTLMGKDTATIGEVLRLNGYTSAWFGKNHNVPDWQTSQAGPFDLWPTALGFEYFYGFIGGDTSQWTPALFEGTRPIEPYIGNPNYILNTDLADRAITYIRQQKGLTPTKPFFVYYVPGATHAPHHAPPSWIEKFQGQFIHGWDKQRELTFENQKTMGIIPANTTLTPRPEGPNGIPAWASFSAEDQTNMAYMMQVYAAFLAHTDYEIGRVIDTIKDLGQEENTLVMVIIGDNGASAEGGKPGTFNEMCSLNYVAPPVEITRARIQDLGGPTTYNHYPIGWAWAMDSPFQWTKQIASHYGGTRNPLIISWPKRIMVDPARNIRTQWHHVIDIFPTILESVGIPVPSTVNGIPQKPVEGISMTYSFDNPSALSQRKTQYFEMFGNRAIYHEGWVAGTTPVAFPWIARPPKVDLIDGYQWELYNVAGDFSQANNLAAQNPDKLKEMQTLFYSEAAKYHVLPLDDRRAERFDVSIRPSLTYGRSNFVYYAGMKRISEGAAPDLKNKSFSISAEIVVPTNGLPVAGVLATQGGRFAGWGLYLLDGKPVYSYNFCGISNYQVSASQPLSPGPHTIRVDFEYDGGDAGGIGLGGMATIHVDGTKNGAGRVEKTNGYRISLDETLDIGEDTGTPVTEDYQVPFPFSGELKQVTILLGAQSPAAQQATQQGIFDKAVRD